MADTSLAKHVADAGSAGIALAAFMKWLPPLAALFTIIWYLIRFYEMTSKKQFADSALGKFLRQIFRMHDA